MSPRAARRRAHEHDQRCRQTGGDGHGQLETIVRVWQQQHLADRVLRPHGFLYCCCTSDRVAGVWHAAVGCTQGQAAYEPRAGHSGVSARGLAGRTNAAVKECC